MRKIVLFIVISLICLYLIVVVFLGFPLVLEFSKVAEQIEILYKKGDIVQPVKDVNFVDNCAIYIVLSRSDYKDLHQSISKRRVLACFDKKTINQLQQEFKFIYTDGDMATCESSIYIFNDKKLIFKSSIVLDKNLVGLQGQQFGWIEACNSNKLIDIIQRFKPVYYPIVIL